MTDQRKNHLIFITARDASRVIMQAYPDAKDAPAEVLQLMEALGNYFVGYAARLASEGSEEETQN